MGDTDEMRLAIVKGEPWARGGSRCCYPLDLCRGLHFLHNKKSLKSAMIFTFKYDIFTKTKKVFTKFKTRLFFFKYQFKEAEKEGREDRRVCYIGRLV